MHNSDNVMHYFPYTDKVEYKVARASCKIRCVENLKLTL